MTARGNEEHRPARVTLTQRDYVALTSLLVAIFSTFAVPAGLWAASVSADIKVIRVQHEHLSNQVIGDLKRRLDRLESRS